MSLNSYAINKAVLNGAGTTQYVQSLTVTSSNTFTLIKSVVASKVISSTNTSSFIKRVSTSKSVASTNTTSKLLTTNKTLSYLTSSSLSKLLVVNKLVSYLSSSSITIVKALSKALSVSSSVVVSLVRAVNRLLTLLFTSTNTATLTKQARLPKTTTATSSVVSFKAISKTIDTGIDHVIVVLLDIAMHLVSISYAITTTNSLSKKFAKALNTINTASVNLYLGYYRVLTATISTTTATINKLVGITRSVVSNTTTTMVRALFKYVLLTYNTVSSATLTKQIAKLFSYLSVSTLLLATKTSRFVLLVTTVYTSAVSYIYRVLPNVVDTLLVPTRKTLVAVVGFVSVLVRPKKTNVVASKQDDLYG